MEVNGQIHILIALSLEERAGGRKANPDAVEGRKIDITVGNFTPEVPRYPVNSLPTILTELFPSCAYIKMFKE
jgi:hypothetical protein